MIKRIVCIVWVIICSWPVIGWAANNDSTAKKAQKLPPLQVRVMGVDDDLKTNIQKRLKAEFKRLPRHTDRAIKHWYSNSNSAVKQALKPYGYFKAHVKRQGLQHEGKGWQVSYRVEKGPPLLINKLDVEIVGPGHDNSDIKQALDKSSIHQGQRFQVSKYQDLKNKLLNTAQHTGYIKAKIAQDAVNINVAQYTCRIHITLDTQKRYYFGPVKFSQTPLNNALLKRYLNFEKGDVFDSRKLMQLQKSLSSGGYFKTVQASPEISSAQSNNVPINVNLNMNKKHRYRLGLGYGTISGMRATAGVDWRWVNRYGHQAGAQITWSETNSNIEAHYSIPGTNPVTDKYVFSGGYYTLNPHNGRSSVAKVGAKYQSRAGLWNYHYGANFVMERFKTRQNPDYRQEHMLVPSVGVGWMSTRHPIGIKRGARFHALVRGTGSALSSGVNFLQTKLRGKVLESLGSSNRFVVSGQLGYTWINDVNKLPLSYQFYAGGPDSVRGYDTQSIGPGRYLGVLSGEYQRRVYGNWFGGVFYDAGTAVENLNKFDKELHRSVGVGVIWQSPVGNIKLYLTHPLNEGHTPIGFEIDMGPEL